MLKLHLLGTADLCDDEGCAVRSVLAQPKRFGLLAYLALAGAFSRRDTLTALFWPELDQERARHALRQSIHYLRRSLGADLIMGRGDEELGVEPGRVWCDAAELSAALESGELERAVGLYSGELLPGFFLDDTPEFERWLEAERGRLRAQAAGAAERLAATAERSGDLAEAVAWRRRQLAILPSDERAIRRLLDVLDRMGDRAGALHAFGEFAELLRLRYDVEPSAETRALVDGIRARDLPLAPSSPAPPSPPDSLPTREPDPARPVGGRRLGPAGRLPRWLQAAAAVGITLGVLGALPVAREALADLRNGEATRSPRVSLAVLPIEDIGPDADAEYLGDGLTDELISVLGQVPNLSVSARTSSYAFKGAATDVREIGRRLGVQHVLEGSVREDRGRVRFSIRLIDVADGRQLWSQIYDRPLLDVLEVQEEIGQAVVAALQGHTALGLGGGVPVARPATASAAAYDDYLRARFLMRSWSLERLEGAIRLFESAIEKDPDFSLAQAGLADAYIGMANHQRPRTVLPKAKAAAQRALALNDGLAETHLALANTLLYYDWDWPGAEREYRRAIELGPSLPSVHHGYAEFLKASRRYDEMIREIRRGLALERAEAVDSLTFAVREHAALASGYLAARQYGRAVAHAQRALELDPSSSARLSLIRASLETGDRARATAELERLRAERGGRPADNARIGRAYALVGDREAALSILRSLEERARTEYVPQDQIGTVYLGLGEIDRAITAFEAAVADRHWFVVHLNSDPIFDPLRSHPRFRRLLQQIRAPAS